MAVLMHLTQTLMDSYLADRWSHYHQGNHCIGIRSSLDQEEGADEQQEIIRSKSSKTIGPDSENLSRDLDKKKKSKNGKNADDEDDIVSPWGRTASTRVNMTI